MAEEEVNYASVVFKNKHKPQPQAEEEETVYSKVKEQSQTSEPSANTNASLITDGNEKSRRPLCLLVASAIVCVILIAAIIVVCISWLKVTKLTTENQNLTTEIHNLTTENDQLTTEIQRLKRENMELKTQSNNLIQQIQGEKTEWIQSNVTRAQWSINAYCPIKYNRRQCQPCQKGWTHKESSCYLFNNARPPGQKTWTEAREVCRGQGSHLVVIADEAEKTNVNEASFGSSGFWIGLRVEDGKWKWVDGSDLTAGLWTEPADEGHCAILFKDQEWRSVRCSDSNQWVCEQAALSV